MPEIFETVLDVAGIIATILVIGTVVGAGIWALASERGIFKK